MSSMMRYVFTCSILATFALLSVASARADCRFVEYSDRIGIDASSLTDLGQIGLNRRKIFDAIKAVSIPETSGCWAGATGNFDDQIVSAGVLQWNYGQNSLQPKMKAFRAEMGSQFPVFVTQ